MWDTVVLNGRENEVIDALRLLEPRLSDIVFLSGAASFRYGSSAGVLVGLEGSRRRVPLGSLGDGMSRLLVLCVSLIQSAGGVLLVDEIGTGLHHLAMGNIWRLILTAAGQYDVQVFATTHSFDCISGLAWVCASHPELGAHVALQKIEPRLEEAVAFDAKSIQTTAAQGIEVR
jgi:hypothetical protein